MQTINLDISRKHCIPPIYAKQSEVGRKFLAVITDNGVPYNIPENSLLSVWYEGDTDAGNYSSIDERSAFSIDGNKVTVELVAQMLLKPGSGELCLSVAHGDGGETNTWNIPYLVEYKPGADSEEATNYYTAFTEVIDAARKFTVDKTLSKSGSPADAAETGRQISVERARIDNIAKLQDGSTTGDAELADIRIGYNGGSYSNAGSAVRGQIKNVLTETKRYDFLTQYGFFPRPADQTRGIEVVKNNAERTYVISNIEAFFFIPFIKNSYIRILNTGGAEITIAFPRGSSDVYSIAYIDIPDDFMVGDNKDFRINATDIKYKSFNPAESIDNERALVLASYNGNESLLKSDYLDRYCEEAVIKQQANSIQENQSAIADIESAIADIESDVDLSADYYQKGNSEKSFPKKVGIIAAGQSNIDGRVPYSDMPSEIKNAMPMANCHYVKNSISGAFASLNITGNWAFDLVTYFNICKDANAELYVIKWSEGGTSIDPDGDSTAHWSADYEKVLAKGHTSLLRKFEDSIRNHIESNGNDFDIRAFIWHQGEGDRDVPENYYENLKYMLSYVRGVVGNKNLPFITGTVSHNSTQFNQTIEDAQTRIAAEDTNFHLIDMSGATLLDPYHFDATSQEYFGKKVYDCLIDIGVVNGEKLNPAKPW